MKAYKTHYKGGVLYSLEDGPVSRALTVEAPLLLAGQDVPDDDRLGVLFCVHQGTESDHVPAGHDHTR